MSITNKAVLVTGANRGIGRALVTEALRRGAKRVYAGTRQPLEHADDRVRPLQLDVTDAGQIAAAVAAVEGDGGLDVLINNAGVALFADIGNRAALERHLAVNLLGTYDVATAFLVLVSSAEGAVVNVLSLAALAPLPFDPTYGVSKSAALTMTQAMRAAFADRGVRVHAVLPGPIDTDMTAGLDLPKTTPEDTARAIFDGIDNGDEEIFPDAMSATMADAWRTSFVKDLERQFAAFANDPAVAS